MVELTKGYDHHQVEEKWFQFWLEKGYFRAEVDWDSPYFSIVIPPPNVTGSLHMGHALNNTLQDILVRWSRMRGLVTLWLPGTDHAGIATQNVVEKKLAAEGQNRWELGREKFLEKVWEWKEQYGSTIINQLKRLGCSCDWSRERFTMDEAYQLAVKKVFVDLYRGGLVYRGNYVINWCPRCQTALSDLEVERGEAAGSLWYIRYPLKGGEGSLSVATTRPETMLGDTAVAVHPADERYKLLIGQPVILPLLEREIPVIADEAVEPEFGTGAVKVTPAHDFVDFEIAQRHQLPLVNIFTPEGKVNQNGGPYEGLDRFKARQRVAEDLEAQGLLEKVEDYQLVLGHCYRCDTVVEPRLSKQWFVKMKPLAEPAIQVVKEGKVRFVPEKWSKVYFDWMESIRDWCISRQIWWGHQIPVWYCVDCGEENVALDLPKACESCSGKNFRQDEDVLDTWFSSALWPFATLGWPEETEDLKYFYPTSLLVTSHDIIFFWVARMIMMGLYFMKEVPFREVYIHALVRDIHGQKMSKSKGNVIDPLDVIEKFGTDALRFTLAVLSVPGRDVYLSEERISGFRDFCNKIWNAARFILMNLSGYSGEELVELSVLDKWILSRYHRLLKTVDEAFEQFDLSQATQAIYSFFWDEFCDWYVEFAKLDLYSGDLKARAKAQWVLVRVLEGCLRLLHPFMPFTTEEIWQLLPHDGESVMVASYPKPQLEWFNESAEQQVNLIIRLVNSIRSVKVALNLKGRETQVWLNLLDAKREELFISFSPHIAALAGTALPEVGKELPRPANSVSIVESGVEIFLPLDKQVDLDKEKQRLRKSLNGVESGLVKVNNKLSNKGFLEKAPPEIVEKEKNKQRELSDKKEQLEKVLRSLEEW